MTLSTFSSIEYLLNIFAILVLISISSFLLFQYSFLLASCFCFIDVVFFLVSFMILRTILPLPQGFHFPAQFVSSEFLFSSSFSAFDVRGFP